jgi:diguanylate cyclase (GGDEF)-like protein
MELFDQSANVLSWDAFVAFSRYVLSHAARRSEALSLLLVGVDDPGPDTGITDASLTELTVRVVGNAISRTVRGGDYVGRHGRLSFAVMARDAQRAGAMRLAERIQAGLPNRLSIFEGATAFTVSVGIANFPQAGTSLQDLVAKAEVALAEAIALGGNRATVSAGGAKPESETETGLRRTLEGLERERTRRLPELRAEMLQVAGQAYQRGETDGIIVKVQPGACATCLDAARDVYKPEDLPGLPVSGCSGTAGCRCTYAPAPVDPRLRPPPQSDAGFSVEDIPRAWRDVARFGADERMTCKPEDLAAYLDIHPPLPQKVALPLEQGEVAYLVRTAEQGWERGVRAGGIAAIGPLIPLSGPLGGWAKQAPRPTPLPGESSRDREAGVLCITNWRLLFSRPAGVDSYLLADISGVEYFRDTLICALAQRPDRLVISVHDSLQVGLCLARSIRSLAHWDH